MESKGETKDETKGDQQYGSDLHKIASCEESKESYLQSYKSFTLHEVMDADRVFRTSGLLSEGVDLVGIDVFNAFRECKYDHPVPCFTPIEWSPNSLTPPADANAYWNAFVAKNTIAAKMLAIPGLAIAGGAR